MKRSLEVGMNQTSLQRAARGTPRSRWTPAAIRAHGVLRLVRRKVARRAVFRSVAEYGVAEAAVLIALAAYFTVGAVAIVLESAK
jgi:hypothetical protein